MSNGRVHGDGNDVAEQEIILGRMMRITSKRDGEDIYKNNKHARGLTREITLGKFDQHVDRHLYGEI